MPSFLIKAALHRLISGLPASQEWNYLFQRHVTKSIVMNPGRFEHKIGSAKRILSYYRKFSGNPDGQFKALELGTGWNPIVPIALYLCGATEVRTLDMVSLLRRRELADVIGYFCSYHDQGKLNDVLPGYDPSRIAPLRDLLSGTERMTPAQILARINIIAEIKDAQATNLPASQFDLLYSESTLLHIPLPVIIGIFKEFHRLSLPGSIMVHCTYLKDAYARFDSSITEFNFLRYSNRAWQWLNSPLEPQNRVRLSDYHHALDAAGFDILFEEIEEGNPSELAKVPVHPEFRHYTEKDLLVIETRIVAVPRSTAKTK